MISSTPAPPRQLGVFRGLARIFPYAKKELPLLVLGMLVALIASVFALAIPLTLEYVVDGPLSEGDPDAVWPAAGLVAALGLAEALFIYLRRVTVLTPGTRIDSNLRNHLYEHLQDLPVAFHDRWHSGQLLSRAQNDVSLLRRWMSFGFVLIVANLITIVLGVAILFSWSPLLAAVFVVCSLPMVIFGSRFRQTFQGLARETQDQWGDVATSVEESVHGIRILKSFGRGTEVFDAFSSSVQRGRDLEVSKGNVLATLGFWLTWVPDFALATSLLAGVWLSSTGSLTTGQLFAFFATAAVLAGPISSLGFLSALALEAKSGLDRIFEVLDTDNPITTINTPRTPNSHAGSLVFENVHFRHRNTPDDKPDLLDGVTLAIRPGETMALVGVTGSGKTTLSALPARLYDVTEGRVLLDGEDIRNLDLTELRTRIAMAFEDATLFSASVRENILFGRADLQDLHSLEAEAVLGKAVSIADADFVYSLPDGTETVIGEQGLSLSGGQRQRVALARAIAAEPDVLVLDDPLSALDIATEARVEAALRKVLATTTALVVAHRPSTVMLADRVALLENGRITAVGTHSELLASSASYRRVISSLPDQAEANR
jgi:ATP-binding cassette subfamily B protein